MERFPLQLGVVLVSLAFPSPEGIPQGSGLTVAGRTVYCHTVVEYTNMEYTNMKGKTLLQIVHEMKYQSMEWKLPKEPSPKKVKASRHSAVKVMLTVFWDAEGIILADFFCL